MYWAGLELKPRWQTPCFEKLSKLNWSNGFQVASYGVSIGVRTNDPSLIPLLRERLPTDVEPDNSPQIDRCFSAILGGDREGARARNFNLLYADHVRLSRSHDLDALLRIFKSFFAISVAELAPSRVFVHAGVVGWKGRAILVPGKSFSGKTSLVAELVRAGATYYSDEYAALDQYGRVHPYSRPLSLRQPIVSGAQRTANSRLQQDVSVEDIGGKQGSRPLPVGLVVMTQFKPGGQWRPRLESPGRGLLHLLANTVSARAEPKRAMEILGRVTAEAAVVKSLRGEASAVAPQILQNLERRNGAHAN